MPKDSLREVRERSEREYQEIVQRIADRVWAMMMQNARQEKERRGADRSKKQ